MVPLGISLGHRLANYLYSPPPFLIRRGKKDSPNKQLEDYSTQTLFNCKKSCCCFV